jgi:hypothetical protein
MLAQGRAFRFWAMRYSFNYRCAFFNFLQVFILGWLVCYFLAACWLMSVLGFGGYFVLLDFHTLIHPIIWSLPLLVASWIASGEGLSLKLTMTLYKIRVLHFISKRVIGSPPSNTGTDSNESIIHYHDQCTAVLMRGF